MRNGIQMAMADLDELVLRCRTDSSKTYLREAVAAYNAGAYRACIVTTWLAVNFDLTAKLRSLAIAGEPRATAWVQKLDRHLSRYQPENLDSIKPLMQIEQQILNNSAEVGIDLISSMERSDLMRLRTDRHRCAHPTMLNGEDVFQPSAELARTHLRNAVDLVLSRRAIAGQRLVDRVLQIIESPGFTATPDELADYLVSEDLLSGFSEASFERLLKTLITGMMAERVSGLERSGRLRVLEAIRIASPSPLEHLISPLLNEANAAAFARSPRLAIGLVANAAWVWGYLNQIEKNRLINEVRTCDVTEGDYQMLKLALGSDALRSIVIDRLEELPIDALSSMSSHVPSSTILDEGCRRLEASRSYAVSKTLLRDVFRPNIDQLEAQHVSAILVIFENNDQVSAATGFPEFLISILQDCSDLVVGEKDCWQRIRPQPWPGDSEDEKSPLAEAIDTKFDY